jgi:hypothetical protein
MNNKTNNEKLNEKNIKKFFVNKKINKKAIYYTLDALLAGIILIGAIVLLIKNPFYDQKMDDSSFLSQDLLSALSTLKVSEIENDFFQQQISSGNISEDVSVIEQLGNYWALNLSDNATALAESALAFLNINNKKISLKIRSSNIGSSSEIIHSSGTPRMDSVSLSRRMIAGIEKGEPLSGASASAYLKRIRNKKTSNYYYFGGFIGQGNTSFFTQNFPLNIDADKIEEIYLEGEFIGDFRFYINGDLCMNGGGEIFSVSSSLNSWSLIDCASAINNGTNYFNINYTEVHDDAVAGGFLRVDYRTDELQQSLPYGENTYYFAGVDGVANIYDSFYIPGTLEEMNVYLHFKTDQIAFLSIGERILTMNSNVTTLDYRNDILLSGDVAFSKSGSEFEVSIDNDFFLSNGFDYGQLSSNTIPLRFAAYNPELVTMVSGNADVVLITDLSGSMKSATDSWGQGNSAPNCDNFMNNPNTRRTRAAVCLDKEFVNHVMNYTGNRIWPAFIFDDEVYSYDNPGDKDAILSVIQNHYNNQGKGKTCLSCAVNEAYNILEQKSDSSRHKFVVLMTDGIPTHCADGSCVSNSTVYGALQCQGLCDTSGACGNINNQCNECMSNTGAIDNLYHSISRIRDDLNVTVFTIGFGPLDDCLLSLEVLNQSAVLGNGTFQHSSDVSELQLIYQNISQEILLRVQQENQTVIIEGANASSSIFGDSYINFKYSPLVPEPSPGKISVSFEVPLDDPFCNNSVSIYPGVEVVNAVITSYSGPHWTDEVIVNNITVFNLSDFPAPYYRLGDPFLVHVPVQALGLENEIIVGTGDNDGNRTGCSINNKFIYTGLVPAVTNRTTVRSEMTGCSWNVSFEDGDFQEIKVPSSYDGSNFCSYTPDLINYNEKDTYDAAMFQLLSELDITNNGKVLININELDLEISTTIISNIPYLWGPSIFEVEVES